MYDQLRKTIIVLCLIIVAFVSADETKHRIIRDDHRYHNPEYILQDFNKNFFW